MAIAIDFILLRLKFYLCRDEKTGDSSLIPFIVTERSSIIVVACPRPMDAHAELVNESETLVRFG